MNMDNKNSKMKKIILANNIFVVVQMFLLVLSVVLNFICDDTKVFLTVFIHIGLFVLFNIIIENMVNYGYIMKKYDKIYQSTNPIKYLQLKKRIYQSAKNNQDKITTTLILQVFVKFVLIIINLILMLFMVNFE
ncbi:MAG: hypothetical protein IKB36_01145 [Clostridia bacterium]|nr:hypothetical protein [Clostridia bacterium]